jgi:hypothetical protein
MDTLFCNPNNGTTSIQFSSIVVDAQSNPKNKIIAYVDEGSRYSVFMCVFFPLSFPVPLEGRGQSGTKCQGGGEEGWGISLCNGFSPLWQVQTKS